MLGFRSKRGKLLPATRERESHLNRPANGVLAGIAGALVSPIRPFDTHIGSLIIVKSFAIAIFGGMGSVPDALVGALIIGIAETMTAAFIASAYSDLVAFGLMIFILFVRPQGLFGKEH